VALVAIAAQPAAAQQSLPIQEAIRGLLQRSGAPIRGERILAVPLDGTAGAFGPSRAGVARATIHGIVQNHLGELVPQAGDVLLRSIADGRVVATVAVDSLAQFTVFDFEPGFYTAQLVDRSGDVLATTGAFTAGSGEVIELATVVPAAPLTNVASLATNVTQSVVSSAASAGVLAVDPGTPISP
jgi:hypothetical protein